MEFKVKKAVGSPDRTVSVISLTEDLQAPEEVRSKIRRDVGDFLVESIIAEVGKAKSPVAGESWPPLSKKYKMHKGAEGLPEIANMELNGDMLDSLTFEETDDGIELGFFGDQAWKADGHLKFSGKDNSTPQRRFLPGEGEEFIPSIQKEVDKIVADAMADAYDFQKSDFEGVSTTNELYSALAQYFSDLTRSEIRAAVARTPTLLQLLTELDIEDLL